MENKVRCINNLMFYGANLTIPVLWSVLEIKSIFPKMITKAT